MLGTNSASQLELGLTDIVTQSVVLCSMIKFNHLLAFLQQGEASFLKNAYFCAIISNKIMKWFLYETKATAH